VVTRQSDIIVVDPVTGLVRVCAWCVPLIRLAELSRAYRCTHTLCAECKTKLEQEVA